LLDVSETRLPGVLLIKPRRFGDARGFFSETWNLAHLEKAGVFLPGFVQDNHSFSMAAGTVRGLHYQSPPHAQGKLVRCGRGRLLDVAVDGRAGSPTYGQWVAEELSFENGLQLWIPAGFLHGFATLEPETEIVYKCTDHYAPECDGAVRFDTVGIDWQIDTANTVLSDKDAKAVAFADWQSPFRWEGA
jgi:dTDP-4-dehydrorhamnose 3,5-epimerase